jgi:hypothetical protein
VQGNLRIFNAQADMLAAQRLQRFRAQGFSEGQVERLGEGEGVRVLRQLIGQSKDAHKMHPMPMFKPMQKIFCYAIFSLILSYLLQPGMILRGECSTVCLCKNMRSSDFGRWLSVDRPYSS